MQIKIIAATALAAYCGLAFAAPAAPSLAEQIINSVKMGAGSGKVLYLLDRVQRGDKTAIAGIKEEAQGKNPMAQTVLGYMLDNGVGEKKDSAMAARFFAAAAKESPLAAYNLGILYKYGRGVPKDEARAMDYFRPAAESGITRAQVQMAVECRKKKDQACAWKWSEQAAMARDGYGHLIFGQMLADGTGKTSSLRLAKDHLSRAADQYIPQAARAYAALLRQTKDENNRLTVIEAAKWQIISTRMGGTSHRGALSTIAGLSDREQSRAQGEASEWFRRHSKPTLVPFDKTIISKTDAAREF